MSGLRSIDELPGRKQEQAPARDRRSRRFDSAVDEVKPKDVARISGRGRHRMKGNYYQVTFRLPEEYVPFIDEIAEEMDVSKEDAKRWLVRQGIRAWLDGRRPEVTEQVVRNKVDLANIS